MNSDIVSTDYSNLKPVGSQTVLDEIIEQENRNRLQEALEHLPQRYREALGASIGIHPGKLSVRQLAKTWGISTQRVYQIKKKAERLLKQALA